MITGTAFYFIDFNRHITLKAPKKMYFVQKSITKIIILIHLKTCINLI